MAGLLFTPPLIIPLHHNTPCPIHTWTRRLLLFPNSRTASNFVFLLRTSTITKRAWMALGLASVRFLQKNSAWLSTRTVLSNWEIKYLSFSSKLPEDLSSNLEKEGFRRVPDRWLPPCWQGSEWLSLSSRQVPT